MPDESNVERLPCPKCGAACRAEDERERSWECGSFELFAPLRIGGSRELLEAGFHQVINHCHCNVLEQQLSRVTAERDAERRLCTRCYYAIKECLSSLDGDSGTVKGEARMRDAVAAVAKRRKEQQAAALKGE